MSDVFAELAQLALRAYDLADAPFTLLQHSENVTFKVNTPNGLHVLRMHIPSVALMGKHGADEAVIDSEMRWLDALRRETDLPVPQPVPNRDGQFVTSVTKSRKKYNCTLLEWVEGQPYQHELESEENVAQMGALIGKLHQFGREWQAPSGFVRPKRDGAYFKKALNALRVTTEDGRASYRDFTSLENAIETLTKMMRQKKNQRLIGLLHGDLHKGNFLYHQGQMRLIDFSMAATGNVLFDLGVCFSDVTPALHPIFLEAYQKQIPLPEDYARQIEAFFLGAMVTTFSFWLNRAEAQEQLVHQISWVARDYAAKFNRDERFWF